jgi:thioredoxin reductase (NADPH)
VAQKVVEKLVIVGSGPAGLTAAVYAGRASLAPLVLSGQLRGGQITWTGQIDNCPGFPDGISGFDLATALERQAAKWGARVVAEEATRLARGADGLVVETGESTIESTAVIVATGSSPRRLGVRGEEELTGRGVSYCATCDGPFFRDMPLVVVGGGNSAVDGALHLAEHASQVTLVHRRDRLRADPVLADRAASHEKINFAWNSTVTEIVGKDSVEGVRLTGVEGGEERVEAANGIFIYIGHIPNTSFVEGFLELDSHGYIVTDQGQRTNQDGVFAAGDVQDYVYQQIVTAAGTGCAAALEAERYIARHEGRAYPGNE